MHGAMRTHNEGRRTRPIFGEGGFGDACLEKVSFELSPEGWQGRRQGKGWWENIMDMEPGHAVLIQPGSFTF